MVNTLRDFSIMCLGNAFMEYFLNIPLSAGQQISTAILFFCIGLVISLWK